MENKKGTESPNNSPVLDTEDIVRILHPEWIVDGKLQLTAFALQPEETYISVNRPSIDSYADDVRQFLIRHTTFFYNDNWYSHAVLHVKDVRSIRVDIDGTPLAVDVEVMARSLHTKSHAGIFTLIEGRNVKTGKVIQIKNQEMGGSSDDILLDVRLALLRKAVKEECIL